VGHDLLPKEVKIFILHLKQQQQKKPFKNHSDFTETLITKDYLHLSFQNLRFVYAPDYLFYYRHLWMQLN